MMESRVAELYGLPTIQLPAEGWASVIQKEHCPYMDRRCLKTRKSRSQETIGTCSVFVGEEKSHMAICPYRFVEKDQIFWDCLKLLTLPMGNEVHVTTNLNVPGGNVDYCLASVTKEGKVADFVGIEFQTLDTTGTVWPERQRLLNDNGLMVERKDRESKSKFGMNWKMTAKTILVQLLHKVETFENVGKKLVLVSQSKLFTYMQKVFAFSHVQQAEPAHSMLFHTYSLKYNAANGYQLTADAEYGTTSEGVARCLRLKKSTAVSITDLQKLLQSKISDKTKLKLNEPSSIPVIKRDAKE